MQEFYINKDSLLPVLRMELIKDGRYNFRNMYYMIQNADISFSMMNVNTGEYKVLNAPCYIVEKDNKSCEEEFVIVHEWKKREINEKGTFQGTFEIIFNDDLTDEDGTVFNGGNLIMPIREDLMIIIK